jgi:hypothetical protein
LAHFWISHFGLFLLRLRKHSLCCLLFLLALITYADDGHHRTCSQFHTNSRPLSFHWI